MIKDSHSYGSIIANLISKASPMPLGPGETSTEYKTMLAALTPEKLFAYHTITDREMAECCLSAILLRYNELDASHRVSQRIDTPEGSYWHGIMHRREPDFSNAKYWFRKVGHHPIEKDLLKHSKKLVENSQAGMASNFLREQDFWDPYSFIDLCETAIDSGSESEKLALEIQEIEWHFLFDYCFTKATS